MSTVRRARERSLLRTVAMKVLDPELAKDPGIARAFVEEAQITGQLDHPNIIPIHELGVDEAGRPYFTMRLVTGTTLTRRIEEAGADRASPRTLSELLHVFLEVCDAVAFAHSRGVLHCDLKPDNILLGRFGEVYVTDWGLARLAGGERAAPSRVRLAADSAQMKSGHRAGLVGTPAYMAPEQAAGGTTPPDERTDVFQLGAVLYHILTGRAPYDAPDVDSSIALAREGWPMPPAEAARDVALAPGICRVCTRAMARDPGGRHPSVRELRGEVLLFLESGSHLPTLSFPPGASIIVEGEAGHSAFVILRGRCVAYRTVGGARRVLREMGPGEVFGEMAVLTDAPRSASVDAVDRVVVTVVMRESLEQGLGLSTWLGPFVKALAHRFREADEKLSRPER